MTDKISRIAEPKLGVFSYSNVVSVTFSEGVSIANNQMGTMFIACHNLVTVNNIPNSVTGMTYTFSGCTNLTEAPNIPNSVINMAGTFQGCTNLTEAPDIPNSVTDMYRTFFGCNKLTTPPILPNNVTTLAGTFQDCTNLTLNGTYNIPRLVTNMVSTFENCVNVTITGVIKIMSNRINNTSMQNCFNGTSKEKTVRVPRTGYNATANTYSAAYNTTYGIHGKNGVTVLTSTEGGGGGAGA